MAALVLGCACALPPVESNVPATPSVIVGHVRVFARGREVTQDCTLGFTDSSQVEIKVRPDASGWVFGSLAKGKARISSVDCDAKSLLATLDFHVPDDGRPTYFGHVRLQLHPETVSVTSPAGQVVRDAIMRDAYVHPPSIVRTAIGVAGSLAATFLLTDTISAGPAKVEVEERTHEAVAAYTIVYRQPPSSLAVSLAGSVFSNESNISPAVRRAGDVIYTEASVGGVRVTWLALSNQAEQNAALRAERAVRKDAPPCTSLRVVAGGREIVIASVSKTQRASALFKQTVQGELDGQALRVVAGAKHVLLDVCGTARVFSATARGAAFNFANAYSALRAKAAATRAAVPADAGAVGEVP